MSGALITISLAAIEAELGYHARLAGNEAMARGRGGWAVALLVMSIYAFVLERAFT